MDHNDIRHMLSEYMDGSLAPGEKASVEEHLKSCPECSNALTELRKTVEHVRKVEEVEPPAWMTQKIMARVRAEREKKRQGLFQRIFFPLPVKLPLETIGVLFIAATVYFVVQDIQETKQRFPEAPVQTSSQEPARSGTDNRKEDKAAKAEDLSQREKEVRQEPGYKALDMKPEYERPPAPQPAPKPQSSVPAEEQRALKNEFFMERKSSDQSATESSQDQETAKAFSGQGAASRAPASAMPRKKAGTDRNEMSGKQMLTLAVSDPEQSPARIEDIVKKFGGKILRRESADMATFLTVSLDPANRNQFIEKLKKLGELKSIDTAENDRAVIEIRIIKQTQQK